MFKTVASVKLDKHQMYLEVYIQLVLKPLIISKHTTEMIKIVTSTLTMCSNSLFVNAMEIFLRIVFYQSIALVPQSTPFIVIWKKHCTNQMAHK